MSNREVKIIRILWFLIFCQFFQVLIIFATSNCTSTIRNVNLSMHLYMLEFQYLCYLFISLTFLFLFLEKYYHFYLQILANFCHLQHTFIFSNVAMYFYFITYLNIKSFINLYTYINTSYFINSGSKSQVNYLNTIS